MTGTTIQAADHAPSRCFFEVLGPLQVTRAGVPVALGGPQQKAVLARLLTNRNRPVSTDQLVSAIWPDRPPLGAVTTIQTYISHLREALEPSRRRDAAPRLLQTEPHGYRLAVEDDAVDALAFELVLSSGRAALVEGRYDAAAEELAAALAMWRGEVLEDLADYPFVSEMAAHLEGLRLSALEDRIDADLGLGRHHQVADELGRLAAAHPLRERLHGQRILAMYRCGQQAEAVASYAELRSTLAGELGIDPHPSIQALYMSMLQQDPVLDWRPDPRSIQGPAREVPPPVARRTPGHAVANGVRHAGSSRLPVVRLIAVAAVLGVVAVGSSAPSAARRATARPFPANTVGRVEADGSVRLPVTVGDGPTGLAYGAGSLWVANQGNGTLSRVDPRAGRVVQTVDVGGAPAAVAVTGDDVWVANGGDGTVSRVNAQTNRVVQTVQVGNLPSAVAGNRDGVWVANTGDDTVQRIDVHSGVAGPPVDVGGRPSGVAVGAGGVWVTNSQDDTVSRIDPVTAETDGPIAVGAGPLGIAASHDGVWVANSLDLSVTRINPATHQVAQVIHVGDGPRSVVVGHGAVWVSDEFDGTLDKIDSHTDRVTRNVHLGGSVRGLADDGSAIWVASTASVGAAHRGGTLRVEGVVVPGFDTIDPARSWLPATFTLAYDGLVALRRTGGAAGATYVPDLATSLPRPTNGGRTYSFTVRSGIHYSDGRLLRAGDLRRGLRRALAAHQPYYSGIVGATGCMARPSTCDLRQGVVVDERASRITFHLTHADPDFLAKMSFAVFAIPPGVRAGEPARPVPATGPYMITDHTAANRKLRLTMVRNPYFHQWSFAARPDGYPDRIVWRRVRPARKLAADIVAGRADLTDPYLGELPTPLMTALARRHPALVHSDPSMGTQYEWLNTRLPPFDDVRVRRALNFAVDRNRLVQLWGGPLRMTVTCQFFSPNSPGHRPYCPYTTSPDIGAGYHGPDLAAAHALVVAAQAVGKEVTVSTSGDPDDTPVTRYLAGVLRSLGLRAHVALDRRAAGRRPTGQMGSAWWGPDFPSPSSYWLPVLSCDSAAPPVTATANLSHFCDPGLDRLARRATQAQASDPAHARRAWSEVDRRLTDEAPWVPGATTRFATVVSARVGGYESHPLLGPLLDRMWVR